MIFGPLAMQRGKPGPQGAGSQVKSIYANHQLRFLIFQHLPMSLLRTLWSPLDATLGLLRESWGVLVQKPYIYTYIYIYIYVYV